MPRLLILACVPILLFSACGGDDAAAPKASPPTKGATSSATVATPITAAPNTPVPATPTATVPAVILPPLDPCSLLTQADVTAFLKDKDAVRQRTGQDCTYTSPSTGGRLQVLVLSTSVTKDDIKQLAGVAQGAQAAREIPGLGDIAIGNGRVITVLKGERAFNVGFAPDNASTPAALLELARLVLSRLP